MSKVDDLFVLDVRGGEGWEKLCPFLGLNVPDVPFPHANEWMHQLLTATAELASIESGLANGGPE